jgi:hypothetical protein
MNNLYEQNILEINRQACDAKFKLDDKKYYSRNDVNEIKLACVYKCIACAAIGSLVTIIILHYS